MHIKTVNTEGEYHSNVMGHNNPVRVDRGKGYGTIYFLGSLLSSFRVDNIYPSFDCGGSQELLLLELRLILVIRRASQYIVYGRSGLCRVCRADCDYARDLPLFNPVVRFSDIPPEVSRLD